MNLARWTPWIGVGLLVATFSVSLLNITRRGREEADPGLRILRIAHWQLEAGPSAAIDEIAREYERRHPGVRVEQLRIPERIYPQWVTTQLVGGTAPDLVQVGTAIDNERLARFFEPVTEHALAPNPYNEGTELAGLPWRETFYDGMASGFDENLQDYYGAAMFVGSVRMFYNRDLLVRITGADAPPRTLAEYEALCRRVREYAVETGRDLVPVAGSRYNAPMMVETQFRAVTQKLALTVAPRLVLRSEPEHVLLGFVEGTLGFATPEVRAGLDVMRRTGRTMQPGFTQLQREDASILFQQGHALMIATGSWDATGMFANDAFRVGAFELPMPMPDDPEFGGFVLGRTAEVGASAFNPFGITRSSPNLELALEFMRFMTSQEQNRVFARVSGWLPMVKGVEPREQMKVFMPRYEGYPQGFGLGLGADTRRILGSSLNQLYQASGTVEAFVGAVEKPYLEAARADLGRILQARLGQAVRSDYVSTANAIRVRRHPEDELLARRVVAQRERLFDNELAHAFYLSRLEQAGP